MPEIESASEDQPNVPEFTELIIKYSDILKANGINDEIENVEVSDPGLQGEHTASSCEVVEITFANKEISRLSLFVKKLTTNPGYADLVKEMNLFAKEAAFFNSFYPAALELCMYETGSQDLIEYFPRCFYADDELIVLENLKAKGFTMLKKEEFQNLEAAKLVMANLARLHAVSYAMIQSNGLESFKARFPTVWMESFVGDNFKQLMNPMYDNSLRTVIAIMQEHPTEGSEEAVQKLQNFIGKAFELTTNCIPYRPNNGDKIIVLNHGDCWNNNMMFSANPETGVVDKNVLIDLQVTRLGSPNLDISYFLFTSVKPNVRREHFESLMKLYFDVFENSVKSLKCEVEITYDDFIEDFKKKCTFGYFMGLTSTCAPGAMAEMDFEKMDPDVEKLVQQMNEITVSWVQRNPNEAAEISKATVSTLDEYLNYVKYIFV